MRVCARLIYTRNLSDRRCFLQYLRENKIFAVPSIDLGACVEVPPQQLKAIYALPESKVSIRWAQSETIQAKYTAADPEIFKINFHVNVIRNQITSSLDYLTGASLNSWQLAL